jgi:chemotaxis methyl-accepting protein methylase
MDLEEKKKLIERSFQEIEEKKKLFTQDPGNSPHYFTDLKQILTEKANLDLSNYREKYLERRFMHRLSALNISSYKKYIRYLNDNPDEIIQMKDSLTIHTTEFFRDHTPFELLRKQILPEIINEKRFASDKTLRIFSAPCSSGQEPYSIAMIIEELHRTRGLTIPIEIYACDIEPKIVEKAKLGRYQLQYMKGIPDDYVDSYFTHIENDIYEIKPVIKKYVTYFLHNLFKPIPSHYKKMDLILCRNLLIYISRERQLLVVNNLQKLLRPNGYLMLGKTESLLILNTKTDFVAENAREHLYKFIPS